MPTSLALWHGQCWYRQHPSWREFNYLFRLSGWMWKCNEGMHWNVLHSPGAWQGADVRLVSWTYTNPCSPPFSAPSVPSLLTPITSRQAHPAIHSISSLQGTAIGGALCWTQHYYRREQAQPLTLGENTGEVAAEATVRPRDIEASWAAWVAKFPGTGPLGGCNLRLEQVPFKEQVHVGLRSLQQLSLETAAGEWKGSETSMHMLPPWALSSYTTTLPFPDATSKHGFVLHAAILEVLYKYPDLCKFRHILVNLCLFF